jgi:regulatory protein
MNNKNSDFRDDKETKRAYHVALRLLAYRPRSRQEIHLRLSRQFSNEATRKVITQLKEHNYIDDASFAKSWRQSRETHQPRSAYLIRVELEQRGVTRELAEAAVANLDNEDSAYRAGARRLKALRNLDQHTFYTRLASYLRRRGFTYSLVHRTIERLVKEAGYS